MQKRIFTMLVMAFVLALIAGCGGLPKDLKKRAETIPAQIEATTQQVNGALKGFDELAKNKEAEFLQPYAKSENWQQYADGARSQLNQANDLNTKLQELVKANDKKTKADAQDLLRRIDTALTTAKEQSRFWQTRSQELINYRDNAKTLQAKAETNAKQVQTIMDKLQVVADKAMTEYPAQKAAITKLVSTPRGMANASAAAIKEVNHQYKEKQPDYASFGKSCQQIDNNLASISNQDRDIRTKLAQLDRSYSKILVDQKAEYFVTVGRWTWDNWSDWDTTKEYIYRPVPVDEDTWEYFSEYPDQPIRTGNSIKCDRTMWNNLKIQDKENWPRGHDGAEWAIMDTPAKYYHNYEIVENGKRSKTGWVPVDDETYDEYWDDIGMEIASKPYGKFESETITTSAPPGMDKVGNEKYGEWRKDDQGRSFWHYYGMYSFYNNLLGPNHYYYRDDWNTWNTRYRGREAYYGRDANNPSYGTYSRNTQTRYSNSSFAKRGGFRGATPSARGAGASSRGGGPGGGGK